MTHVFNDPAVFTEESLDGLVSVHSGLLRKVPGGVVSRAIAKDGKVSIVVGGGSGHYPMFAGLVGVGLADGAVVGNIFTSPSAQYAYSVARRADRGGGVIFCYGNYAGDLLNFGSAQERLVAAGIPTRSVVVKDDVLSAPPAEREKRRGLAGDFVVLRALAGAAARGLPLEEVVAAGEKANARTRTVGVAFAGCTFPGATHRLFEVPEGKMAIGLGVHGEPGLELIDAVPARELARILFEHVVSDPPLDAGERVAVIVNGLGATKAEELFLLWRDTVPLIEAKGWTAVEPEVGEIITSLDMSGLSLTVCWLDAELESYWTAPAYGPGYRKGAAAVVVGDAAEGNSEDLAELPIPDASDTSRVLARRAATSLGTVLTAIRMAEETLGDADAVAGDGDHGRGMVRGLEAAVEGAKRAVDAGAGLGTTVSAAGDAWGELAGGTSGALWSAGLRAFGATLGDTATPTPQDLAAAAAAFERTIQRLGRVQLGDKSMLDAIAPAVAAFTEAVSSGAHLGAAMTSAADAAEQAAAATASLVPKVGRARPLAEQSVGHPDPGALSFALIVRSLDVRTLHNVDEDKADGTDGASVAR